ncbi:MAG: class I tRNA ligase family protein [Patescibacteria group bacterium]
MAEYNHLKIESKWQKEWEKKKIYQAKDEAKTKQKKYYSLIEFPYPSSDGLHVGHPRPYIGMDVISRKKRMEGYNVLYPIGWDAFGLPTENYAIKTGKDPRVVTKKNSDNFRRQIKSIGISFDWSREVNTTDPEYYKWTQWIFLQFFKKGLAYKAKMAINWCPKDKIGLANEEVIDGKCERCGTEVEKRDKEQWMLGITKYAERLDRDLDTVDYLPSIKLAQRNWIGRSEGAEISFKVESEKLKEEIVVFTTRPDTIFGATFIVVAGKEDRFTGKYATNPATQEKIPVWEAEYVMSDYGTGAIMGVPGHDERDYEFAKKHKLPIKNVIEPVFIDEPKDGLPFVDRNAIHAIVKHWSENKYLVLFWKKVNWVTFVTGGIDTGESPQEAAVREIKEETGYINLKLKKELPRSHSKFYHTPKKENRFAHFSNFYFELQNGEQKELSDEEKENHELKWVSPDEVEKVMKIGGSLRDWRILQRDESVYAGSGIMTNSGQFDGLETEKAKKEIIKFVGGKEKTTFKLRDWIFSRQRYWGEPIPIINCEKCGYVPVPEKDLPVELPRVKNYQPTDSGESPLANISKWVNVKCPKCKGKAKRETDTMPNWAGSSWYYLRYTDPKNKKVFASQKKLKYWLGVDPVRSRAHAKGASPSDRGAATSNGVDWYNGGYEHTTLHLLYSRFWHKFLFDLGLVPTSEPYKKRTSHGLILGEGGIKMSKSLGNVINPDDIVKTYGADTLRLYEMFMGPFDQKIAWSEEAIVGPRRFLERVWKIASQVQKNFAALPASGLRHGQNFSAPAPLVSLLHKTIKKISEDIEAMKFNTAISALMIFVNEIEKQGSVSKGIYEDFLKLLSPFAPHITEELWQILGHKKSIHLPPWPISDVSKEEIEEVTFAVQINGKVRGQFRALKNITASEASNIAEKLPEVQKWLKGETPKFIYVPGRLVNIVI